MAKQRRIALGMSGGVDSAVAAALLARDGWEVVGVTCRFLNTPEADGCIHDASRVAEQMGIEHVVIDACETFEQKVVAPFVRDYARGLTPSPCVGCNATAKIPSLMRAAQKLGCEAWATGHYARVVYRDGRFAIQIASHLEKDQSYMLGLLTQNQLEHLVLPLGEYTKQQVRKIAESLNLSIAKKPESQDICFAPCGYRALLRKRAIEQNPGQIVNAQGEVLGQHTGLCDYTIGQRKGIGVAAAYPYYVIDKRSATNELVIGFAEEAKVTQVLIGDVVWQALSEASFKMCKPYEAEVKLRYRSTAGACIMEPAENNTYTVRLRDPQTLTAPGQYAVLYRQGVVLASGKILEVSNS